MSLSFAAKWEIVGLVMEKRELTPKSGGTWRGYVAKMATIGHTIEVNMSLEQYQGLGVGQPYRVTGHFEDIKGSLRLTVDKFELVKSAA